jgi:hypothetical protein
MYKKIIAQKDTPEDLEVQIAILVDITSVSPTTFPAAVGILSHLVSLAHQDNKKGLWERVAAKIRRIPYNGYQEIWLQRVIRAQTHQYEFQSVEPICGIVDSIPHPLWFSDWISSQALKKALDTKTIIVKSAGSMPGVVQPREIELFITQSEVY